MMQKCQLFLNIKIILKKSPPKILQITGDGAPLPLPDHCLLNVVFRWNFILMLLMVDADDHHHDGNGDAADDADDDQCGDCDVPTVFVIILLSCHYFVIISLCQIVLFIRHRPRQCCDPIPNCSK